MLQPWKPERLVDEALATVLIEVQFPELAPVQVDLLGTGWDNTAYRVNWQYVFRFPRRQIAVDLLAAETGLLPSLAPAVPLPIPVPLYCGQPEERFPWPFAGYALLPGRPACEAVLDDSQRERAVEPLARFLAALHSFPAGEARRRGVPGDVLRRLDVRARAGRARERLESLTRNGVIREPGSVAAILDDAPLDAAPHDDTLVHGDLYARHILVDSSGLPCGIIDWGDIHVGDPAADLMLAYAFLPARLRERFFRIYGPVDDQTHLLARFRCLDHTLAVLDYASASEDADLVGEALGSLDRVAAE